MTTNDIPAIRAQSARYAAAIGPGGDKAWQASQMAARVPALCDEVEQLRAEIDQLRSENHTLERAVMEGIVTARPVLPYRSTTVDGLSGVTLAVADGQVLVDGLAHTPAAALELSAAIARAAGAIPATCRTAEEVRP